MDKFLELSFRNHTRQNDETVDQFYKILEPIMDEIRKYVSKEIADHIENDLFLDLTTEAFDYAGVVGMELAIGVMNGTIKQVL